MRRGVLAPAYTITTLGCPKNQADSREMERSLIGAGFEPVADPGKADVHIINTCSFILEAREETIENIFEAAGIKAERKEGQKLVLAGCFSQRYPDAISKEIPEVDLAFGTGQYHRAGELVGNLFQTGTTASPGEENAVQPLGITPPYAPVKVSDGCDRSCAFCAIPVIRGRFVSLPAPAILEEIHRLTSEGVREIDLVSQDTGQYGGDPDIFLDLLERIQEIDDVTWIRLLYLYPDARASKILEGIKRRGIEKIVPYLESPIQHVSERMLKAMGRSGNPGWFKDFFARARQDFPELEIRTTFLIGFPGENREDIQEIFDFLDEIRPEKLALFSYSPEEDTPAFQKYGEKKAPSKEFINRIRNRHLEILKDIHLKRIGRVYRCMVDEVQSEELLVRRPQDAPEADEVVHIPRIPGLKAGDLLDVRITGFFEYDMTGEVLEGGNA